MRGFRTLLILSAAGLLIVACAPRIQPTQALATTIPATALTSTPSTTKPSKSPTGGPTATRRAIGQLGLVATLGEKPTDGPGPSTRLAFSPNGGIVALAGSSVRLWDVRTHLLIQQWQNPYAGCVASEALFSPDGRMFGASMSSCSGVESGAGNLVVWDVATGELLQHWMQEPATMPNARFPDAPYSIAVPAFAFLPHSSKIVFASGHALEIIDVRHDANAASIDLGPNMFASQLSISQDGRSVYALMDWNKDLDWPSDYTRQYKVQVWDVGTLQMRREINYPEWKYPEVWESYYELHGPNVVNFDYGQGVYQSFSLETDQKRDLPLRAGERYLSQDLHWAIFARLYSADLKDGELELWDTDTRRDVYSFLPDFAMDTRYGNTFAAIDEIAFSPDDALLAMSHEGQVSLWDISPVTEP